MGSSSSLKSYFIDMNGVLMRGAAPIPGAPEFIGMLAERAAKFLLLTDNSMYTPRDLRLRLDAVGSTYLQSRSTPRQWRPRVSYTPSILRKPASVGTRSFFSTSGTSRLSPFTKAFLLKERKTSPAPVLQCFAASRQNAGYASTLRDPSPSSPSSCSPRGRGQVPRSARSRRRLRSCG